MINFNNLNSGILIRNNKMNNTNNINYIKTKIINFLNKSFKILKINNNILKIISPFLTASNDNITFYVVLNNKNILLTDDGYTICGFNIQIKQYQNLFKKLLKEYNIEFKNNNLYVKVEDELLEKKLFEYLQFLILVNNIFLYCEK